MDRGAWWAMVHRVAKSTTPRMHIQKLPQGEFSLDFENNRTQVVQYLNGKIYFSFIFFFSK